MLLKLVIYFALWCSAAATKLDELDILLQCNQPIEVKFRSEFFSEEAKCIAFHSDSIPSLMEVLFQVENESDAEVSSSQSNLASKFKIKLLFPGEGLLNGYAGFVLGDSHGNRNSVDSEAMVHILWDESMNVDNVHFRKYISSSKVTAKEGFYQVS